MNLGAVELATLAEGDELKPAPCMHGLIVEGHACYCHDDEWKEGPRKCPVYRNFGIDDASKWFNRPWVEIEIPMYKGWDLPPQLEMRPSVPDDGLGGCPHFTPL